MSKHDRPSGSKKSEPFNNPFQGLKAELKRAKAEAACPLSRPPPPPSPARRPSASPGDEELFAQAMSGVAPLADNHHGIAPPPPPRQAHVVSEDAEALARLSELVSGEGPFDISSTDEFIEGVAPGADRRVLEPLRRGEFAVQGHLDLHGLTKPEAKEAVDRFFSESMRTGKRCVVVIHGRGLNSKDQIPVLKGQLRVWLQRGRIGRSVLAFATARPHDGGSGALYVLLRR